MTPLEVGGLLTFETSNNSTGEDIYDMICY